MPKLGETLLDNLRKSRRFKLSQRKPSVHLRLRAGFRIAILGLTALALANGAAAMYLAWEHGLWATCGLGVSMTLAAVLCASAIRRFTQGVLLPLERMTGIVQQVSGIEAAGASLPAEIDAIERHLDRLMTEVTDARTSLDRSWNALVEAEKLAAVGKLAAGLAHEIRNPLAAITMWLFVIRNAVGPDAELGHKFDIISEEMARLEDMLRGFLEFSRLPMAARAESVSELIRKTLDLARHQIHQKRIQVLCEEAPDLPPVVADAQQLKQVFLNLLNNAIEATPEGGELRFFAKLEHDPQQRPVVVVRVQDTGPGVPAAARPRIFEPFYTTKDNGTGLGLYIAAQIMTRMGGRLALEYSHAGQTSFAAWIPPAHTEEHE